MLLTCTANAQLTIPSDGSDGALNITADTVIDLSQAVTGTWDQNNAANAGKGVYDPAKWAIVFKYSSVNIAGLTGGSPPVLVGRNVTFINHPSRAPVVWLVQGNVTINGIVNLRGKNGTFDVVASLTPAEPGPGGFRGAAQGPNGFGLGYGPGPGGDSGNTSGGRYAIAYGNPQIVPLIGGSGGVGGSGRGSAGGGCILIACSGTLSLNGLIDANGGDFSQFNWGGGAGGAVKLIANSVVGNGSISAINNWASVSNSNNGRIRIETPSLSPGIRTAPETIGVPPANPPILWPAANAPTARVVSVDSVPAPTDPTSPLIAAADIAIQNNAPVNILIETRNFPIEGVVQLAAIPKFSTNRPWLAATRISGDINVATWRVTTVLPQGFVTLQARATQP